jgi:uncharacterized protein YndB with AHSA1/START domain
MTAQTTPDGVCQTSRVFPFTAADIFAAFSDAEQLAVWWGPDGFRNTFDVFEFQPQGAWKFVMHGPDGQNYSNESVFLEVSREKIVIRHTNAPNFTLTVTLQGVGNQTELHWHQAFDDPQLAASIAHIIVPANEQNLDRLQALLGRATK